MNNSHKLFSFEPCAEPGCENERADDLRICEEHRDENLDIPDPIEDAGWPKRVTHCDGHVAVYHSVAEWRKVARERFNRLHGDLCQQHQQR